MAVNDEELKVMADEELASAVSLKWAELQRITPWGDTFDAFAPSGRKVEIERRYLWAHDPVGAVLVEVEIRDRSNRTGVEARALLAPPVSR